MTTRVLIADPDTYLLTLYREHLAPNGFDVTVARDGLECLEQLRRCEPDVLVLDPAIPWGGGDGVMEVMHEDLDLPKAPVVLLLTHGCGSAVLYNIAHFPISDYRMKPMDGRRLVHWIRSVLERSETGWMLREAVEGRR